MYVRGISYPITCSLRFLWLVWPPHGFPFGIALAAISSSQPNAKEVKREEAATPLIVPRLSFRPVRRQRICIGKADDPHQLKQERTNAPKRTLETATRA